MSMPDDGLSILDAAWRDDIREQMDDASVFWGQVVEVGSDYVVCLKAQLQAYSGLEIVEPSQHCRIHLKGCHVDFQFLNWIGWTDFKEDGPGEFSWTHDATMWRIPEYRKGEAFHVGHLFSGSFCGWNKAWMWMKQQKLIRCDSVFYVDNDPEATKIWELLDFDVHRFKVPFNCESDDQAASVLVEEPTWLNLCRNELNMVWTISPPCISWSSGGKESGLHSRAGLSFLQAVKKVRWARPVAAFFECTEKTPIHPHFKIIQSALRKAGYVCTWNTINDVSPMTQQSRKRWLSVWIRHDLHVHRVVGSFKFTAVDATAWTHPSFDFKVPRVIKDQLALTCELEEIYGDPKLLAPGLKSTVGPAPTMKQVLNFRCIKAEGVMPTVVANYSSQHQLDKEHLQSRGIYAFLTCDHEKYEFVDPIRCIAMLGAPQNAITIFPTVLKKAFQQIGNSIAVPHAVLVSLVGLNNIGFDIDIKQNVESIWLDRIKPDSIVAACIRDHAWIVPIAEFDRMCALAIRDMPCGRIQLSTFHFRINISDEITPRQFLAFAGLDASAIACCLCFAVIPKACSHLLAFVCSQQQDIRLCTCIPGTMIEHLFGDCDVHVNGQTKTSQYEINDGDFVVPPNDAKRKRPDHIQSRLDAAFKYGCAMGRDECAIFCQTQWHSHTIFAEPIVMQKLPCHFFHAIDDILSGVKSDTKQIFVPILVDCHWCALETNIEMPGFFSVAMLNVRDDQMKLDQNIVQSAFGQKGIRTVVRHIMTPVPQGICGWSIINRWIMKFGALEPSKPVDSELAQIIDMTLNNEELNSIPRIKHTAIVTRTALFSACIETNHVEATLFGFTGNGEIKDTEMKQDPFQLADPWMRTPGSKQTRWEDLHLPPNHGLVDQDKRKLIQLNRLQISKNNGGVAFCTRKNISEVLNLEPLQTTILLVPNTDKTSLANLRPKPDIRGPIEISIIDPANGVLAKRQVLMVCVKGQASVEHAQPVYTANIDTVSEVVVEADSRLLSKEAFTQIQTNPLEQMRNRIHEQFPTGNRTIHVYAVRHLRHASDVNVVQVMAKMPQTNRKPFLERSGLGDLIARDFVEKGQNPEDRSVIPKFFPVNRSGQNEILRMASSLKGFAGLVSTRRGLAVRSWNSDIASVRRIMLPQDERLNETNLSIVPKVMLNSTGWPPCVAPSEVIACTLQATKLAPILTRCFKNMGVTTWSLGFAQRPTIDKFCAKFNEVVCEIILTDIEDKAAVKGKQPASKGKGKGKTTGKSSPSTPSQENPLQERVALLETRFSSLEKRTDSLDEKVQSGFQGVQDQLRQVLNALSSRPAPVVQGESPPPKQSKLG
eukprot:Skav228176  [mRNA]  locus=scaffold3933:151340:155638:+ [translate_table: standard]